MDADKEKLILQSVQHNFHKAWCDTMRDKIVQKDWAMFDHCLAEIVQRLKNMIPNLHKKHEEIDRQIPVDLITQMLHNDAVVPGDFLQYMGAIMDWMKALGPPDLDDAVDEMVNDTGNIPPEKYLESLPDTMLAINLHLDALEFRIDKFKDELLSHIADGDNCK